MPFLLCFFLWFPFTKFFEVFPFLFSYAQTKHIKETILFGLIKVYIRKICPQAKTNSLCFGLLTNSFQFSFFRECTMTLKLSKRFSAGGLSGEDAPNHFIIATMKSNVVQCFLVVVVVCCFQAHFIYHFSCHFSGVVPAVKVSPSQNHSLSVEQAKRESADTIKRGRVYACVFTGRWIYLRILLPYLYRELRQNGGVVDGVIFVMIGYTEEARSKLKNFVTAASSILKNEAFEFLYLREDPSPPDDPGHMHPFYCRFYYIVLQRLLRNPSDVYFKMDDDTVYLHPNVFGSMINNKNTSECFLHYGNIVSNWRCNWLHQKIGVYDNEVNPKGLKFDFAPDAPCGWRSPECAEMVLRTCIHHYHKKQLDRYLFRGRDLTTKGQRFSVNLFLLDVDIVDFERMMQTGPIKDDEVWWSIHYSSKAPQTNCIVGEAFVVHFSYAVTTKQMLDLGLLKEFENIVRIELGQTLPETFLFVLFCYLS